MRSQRVRLTLMGVLLAALALSAPHITFAADEAGDATQPQVVESPAESVPESSESLEQVEDSSDGGGTEDQPAEESTHDLSATDEALASTEGAEEHEQLEVQAQSDLTQAQDDLDAYAAAHATDLPSGCYALVSNAKKATVGDAANYAIDLRRSSMEPGADIILYSASKGDNQRWNIKHVDGGYVTIQSLKSGLFLDVIDGDDAAAAAKRSSVTVVQTRRRTSGKGQLWIASREDDGSIKFTSALLRSDGTRFVLDVRYGKAKNGATVVLYAEKTAGADNQRWSVSVPEDVLDRVAATHAIDLADGLYVFSTALKQGMVLNVRYGSVNNGGSIVLYPGGTKTNEVWRVTHDEQGYATIVSLKSGKALDVRGGKAVEGASVIQYTSKNDGSRNQKWIIALTEAGNYELISAMPGATCFDLSVSGGIAKTSAAACLGAARDGWPSDQRWNITAAPEHLAHFKDLADGTYAITTLCDLTKCLDVSKNSKEPGTQVKLYTAKSSANQLWISSYDADGYVHFKNKNSGLELAMEGGVLVQSATPYSWIALARDDGYYHVQDAMTSKYLDLSRSKVANGSAISTYTANGGNNQIWNITEDAGFVTRDGKKYLLDVDGNTLTGLRKVNGKLYYFDPVKGGAMATSGIYNKQYLIAWDGVLHEMDRHVSGASASAIAADEIRMAALVASCVIPADKIPDSSVTASRGRDLIRVESAAKYIRAIAELGTYQYNRAALFDKAYGVFISGYHSCSGCTEALGLVLKQLGYSYSFINYGLNIHQWNELKMDGKTGWADGLNGKAGYNPYAASYAVISTRTPR